MNYNNANNNNEKTTEHINTAAIMQDVVKPFVNAGIVSKIVPVLSPEEKVFITALSFPRLSLLKKVKALEAITPAVEEYLPAVEEANHARLRLSAALIKRPEFSAVFGTVYILSAYLKENLFDLVALLENNAPVKKTVSKAVMDKATFDYAMSLVNGTVARSNGLAGSLKQTALLLSHHRDSENPMEFTAVDSALNKVYAAVRRQAKKNGVEISAKSNKVTKDAVKIAVMERIREMQANHEYAFEVLIGETP